MDERAKKAFDYAQETTKQFIGLATGIIALTITFSRDFVSALGGTARTLAVVSWAFYLVSVLFGLLVLMALTGTLEPTDQDAPVSIRGKNVTRPAGLQIVAFFVGLLLTVLFGAVAMRGGA